MNLMPDTERLTTEHIKSHLQKYRLHYTRSKDEFLEFYELRLKEKFAQFCTAMQWRDLPPHLTDETGTGSFGHFQKVHTADALHACISYVVKHDSMLNADTVTHRTICYAYLYCTTQMIWRIS
jgi:hypothetical protein